MAKKPNRRQKELIQKFNLNPTNWLVLKNPVNELYIKHRSTGRTRVLKIQSI